MFPRKNTAKYAVILIGAAVLAFGLYNVHAQSGVTEGGVLGAMLLLEHWTGISPAISGIVLDCVCFFIGFKVLGKGFIRYSLAATASFSIFYALMERFPPLLPDYSGQPALAAILGGVLVGLGCGSIVLIGGASGGDDALAMSVSKLARWPISRVYLITDAAVLLASLSYLPLHRIGWSLLTVTVSSALIETVQRLGAAARRADNAHPLNHLAESLSSR